MLPITSANTIKRAHDRAFSENIQLQTGITLKTTCFPFVSRLHTPQKAAERSSSFEKRSLKDTKYTKKNFKAE